jgi:hypothetical protein
MKTIAPLLLLPLVAFAQVNLKNGPTRLGPVRDLICASDAGIYCARDAGSSAGLLSCNPASSTETGCVTVSAQTWAGNKTFTGNVLTPLVDAGIGAIASFDIRASTIKNTDTATALTLQSNAADGVTTSTVPAMNFALGSDITNTDLAWCFTDSAGNQRLCGTEAGTWTFAAHATTSGAVTAVGGSFSSALGSGGAASGVTSGGAGGAYTFTAGTGGAAATLANGGAGGACTVAAGAGGADNISGAIGGPGGALTLRAGAAGGGHIGGAVTIQGGAGGASNATHGSNVGGDVTITAGTGGAEAAGGNANPGGAVTITAGTGGANSSGAAGLGGALTIRSGGGGAAGAGTGSSGGALIIDTGAATGAATAATLSIGATNAGAMTIGRSGQSITVNGYGVLTSHGTTVLSVEKGATAMTASELAVTFATAFAAAPSCTCTHVNTTNTNACNIKSGAAPTTTTVTFAVASGGTDVVDWICIGTR